MSARIPEPAAMVTAATVAVATAIFVLIATAAILTFPALASGIFVSLPIALTSFFHEPVYLATLFPDPRWWHVRLVGLTTLEFRLSRRQFFAERDQIHF